MPQIVAALALIASMAVAPVRVQLTTGGHAHGLSFYKVFEGRSDLAITVNPHPAAFRGPLRKHADVLVLYDRYSANEKEQQNLRNFLENGGGVVVLHHALASNWEWKWWYEEVVGGRFLMGQDGNTRRSQARGLMAMEARPVAKHPVLDGVGVLEFEDEGYTGMYLSPEATVLMETENDKNDRAVAWIGPWQKSRVVVIQLGHGAPAHLDPGYQRLVYNAILWAAGRKQ